MLSSSTSSTLFSQSQDQFGRKTTSRIDVSLASSWVSWGMGDNDDANGRPSDDETILTQASAEVKRLDREEHERRYAEIRSIQQDHTNRVKELLAFIKDPFSIPADQLNQQVEGASVLSLDRMENEYLSLLKQYGFIQGVKTDKDNLNNDVILASPRSFVMYLQIVRLHVAKLTLYYRHINSQVSADKVQFDPHLFHISGLKRLVCSYYDNYETSDEELIDDSPLTAKFKA